MSGNSFGKALVLTTFGESHGVAVGGVLDGFPANLEISLAFVQDELDRRRPGGAFFSSPRPEEDKLEILSGLFEGKSTGAPIAFIVFNHQQKPSDYDHLRDVFRPSHADYSWQQKYGIRDPRGGGRSSARETLARVAGGAFAKIFLLTKNIHIKASISQIGQFQIQDDASGIDQPEIISFLEQIKAGGDTIGGVISCTITGVPAGLGEPVFDKLHADLGKAMLSINAVKGFEYGSGFNGASMRGSEHNDRFVNEKGVIKTLTNNSGGIQGGISNGADIFFRVAFKPVSTLMQDQVTVNASGDSVIFQGKGRHDVCVVPRALPIVEAMAALVMADHLIRNRGESNRVTK
ncbi:MAG: chorismate synthase [Bacteroidetes bacterium]|nr:chorismate synthase [Bacteroidota bacterium]